MTTLWQDTTLAARKALREPVHSIVAVATLGIGIAAVVAVFSVVNAIQFRPLPFPHADRLVWLGEFHPERTCATCGPGTSFATLQDWRSQTRSFEALGGYTYYEPFTVVSAAGAERVHGSAASWDLFPLLGLTPAIGRAFIPDDDRTGSVPVAIISHRLWQGRFGGDTSAVGRAITVTGVPRVVVGVMGPGVDYPYRSDVWIPLTPSRLASGRGERGISVVARLRQGVPPAVARDEMTVIARRVASAYPATNGGWTVRVQPFRAGLIEEYDDRFRLFVFTVAMVLLVVCANVGSLELARAATRARDIALRAALGATRSRLVRQLLLETTVLAFVSSIVGGIVAWWSVDLVTRLYGHLPFWVDVTLDWRVLSVAAGLAMLTGALTGVIPALELTGQGLSTVLLGASSRATTSRRHARWQSASIVAQVTATMVLLTAAASSARTLVRMQTVDRGWEPRGLASADIERVVGPADSVGMRRFIESVVGQVERERGVVSAAAFALDPGLPPFTGSGVTVETSSTPVFDVVWRFLGVTRGYFGTLRLPLRAGRSFTESEERRGSAVVVLTESVASRLWPGQSALGRRIKIGPPSSPSPWFTVVGVVASPRTATRAGWTEARYAYIPLLAWASGTFTLYARDRGDGTAALTALRSAVRRVDPLEPVDRATTLEAELAAERRAAAVDVSALSSFALFALALTVMGLSVLIARLVRLQTRAIAIRFALGATARDMTVAVARRGAALAALGVGIGLGLSLAAGRVIETYVRGFAGSSVWEVLLAGAALLVAAVFSSVVQARAVGRIPPTIALQAE